MKTTINTLLATIAITLTASGDPTLLVETTITEQNTKGGKDILARPRITVESGKQATIQVGKLEFTFTPTLMDGGSVVVPFVITKRDGKKADQLAAPQIATALGKAAEIKVGELTFTFKTSLVK